MLSRFRSIYERITTPLGRACVLLGLTPNSLTALSLCLAFLGCAALARGMLWWGFSLTILMYLADMLDGATARAGNTDSPFGTVLDHTVDRYAEFCVLLGLMLGGYLAPALAMFTIFGMVMASYVRAKAESAGGLRDCVVGLAGRAEKLILLLVGMGLQGLGATWLPIQWAALVVGLVSHITYLQRLLYTYRMISKPTYRPKSAVAENLGTGG